MKIRAVVAFEISFLVILERAVALKTRVKIMVKTKEPGTNPNLYPDLCLNPKKSS